MGAIQLIICMETNEKCKSGFIYINSIIEKYFVRDSSVLISLVYMDGKHKYNSKSVTSKINDYIKQFKKTGDSKVIYCFDTDNYDSVSNDVNFINETRSYCSSNHYDYVWFCKDIERVFLGKAVPDSEKRLLLSSIKRAMALIRLK